MNLLEYQAHELFSQYSLPSLKGHVIDSIEHIDQSIQRISSYPVVLKAQVPIGGRGKAGGIAIVNSPEEAKKEARRIFSLVIGEFSVNRIFVVPQVEIEHEMYLSLVMDRASHNIVILFSDQGGVDINDIAEKNPSSIIKIELDPYQQIRSHTIWYILSKSKVAFQFDQLFSLLTSLLLLMKEHHCLLVEVNPLVLDAQGNLVLVDGKITIDDNALGKLNKYLELRNNAEINPQIIRARNSRLLFIPIEQESGTIGIISNGSGMIMSSIDLISQSGGIVSSALDLGGGATSDRVSEAVKIILMDSKVKILFINIFGGITRCDEIVHGVIEAYTQTHSSVPLVLRLEGTNKDKGLELLEEQNFVHCSVADNLNDGVRVIIHLIKENSYECIS